MRSKQRFKSDRHDLSIVKFIKLHLCGDDKRIYSFNCVKTSRYGNSEKLIKKKAKSHQKKKNRIEKVWNTLLIFHITIKAEILVESQVKITKYKI